MTDAEAVARLEALVQSQQPASAPWTPVTDYSLEARRIAEGPHAQLIKDVFQPAYALDAGCGPDAILVRLLREVGVHAVGFDVQAGVEQVLDGFDLAAVRHDAQRMIWSPVGKLGPADLVICREVLEHLTVRHLVKAVRNLVRLSSKYIYVTTRFHQSPSHLLDVATSDDLDPTHISMCNKDFLRALFVLEGCRSRPDLEARMDHQHKGRCLVFEVA